jgi:hypothetical protein
MHRTYHESGGSNVYVSCVSRGFKIYSSDKKNQSMSISAHYCLINVQAPTNDSEVEAKNGRCERKIRKGNCTPTDYRA